MNITPYIMPWGKEHFCTCALQNNGIMGKLMQGEISMQAGDGKLTFPE